jgi:hypothetical protein
VSENTEQEEGMPNEFVSENTEQEEVMPNEFVSENTEQEEGLPPIESRCNESLEVIF